MEQAQRGAGPGTGAAGPTEASPGPTGPPLVAGAAVAGGLLVAAAVVGHRLWFFSDDWNIYAEYHRGNLLEPFNGHLSLVPAGIYQFLFNTLGVGSYLPYRLCGLVALGILAFQVLRWSRPLVGPWPAVLAMAAVLWNSYGETNVMFPFLMNFSLPIAALLAMWWHLDRGGVEQRFALMPGRSLLALGLWAALALATSGLGVVALAALATELVLRRAHWRVWAVLAVPSAAWGAWWLANREANELSTDVGAVISYAVRMLWAGATSLAAGWAPGGLVLAAVLAALAVVSARRVGRPDPRAAGALAAAVAFAGLTSLTRQDTVPPIPPDELRYGWTIGAYLVFTAVALGGTLRGAGRDAAERPATPRPWPRSALLAGALAAAVLAIGAVRLLDGMRDWTDTVADAAPGLRTNLYAAEAAGAARLDGDTVIRPLSYVPVYARDYLDGVSAVGSPLDGATGDDLGGTAGQRRAADELFFGAVTPELRTEPVPAAARTCAPRLAAAPGERVVVTLTVVEGEEALRDPVVVVSRFSDDDVVALPVAGVGVARTLVLPPDAEVSTPVVLPYRLRGLGGVELCVGDGPR